MPASRAVRDAAFHVASVISTTGFSVDNQDAWPPLAKTAIFFLMFIGGCTGSTAGGIKVLRWLILCKQSKNEMKKMIYPHGVFSIQLDGRAAKKEIVYGVAGFIFVYLFLAFLSFVLIALSGANLFDSLNASLTCLGNIGLGFTTSGQGMDSFLQGLPAWLKCYLSLIMLAGRLELWAVLVFFSRDYWRRR
jgi:trk system potassium uptake protein TrkH